MVQRGRGIIDYTLIHKRKKVVQVTPNRDFIIATELLRGKKQTDHLSDIGFFVSLCESLGIKQAQFFLDQMLTPDFLIANEDRHIGNFGVIRNEETQEYTGMAPVYDNGTSEWLDLKKLDGIEEECGSVIIRKRYSIACDISIGSG